MITPTQHEKNEWSRCAQAAYKAKRNDVGHKLSMAAALRNNESVPLGFYDSVQTVYRKWLVFNELPVQGA